MALEFVPIVAVLSCSAVNGASWKILSPFRMLDTIPDTVAEGPEGEKAAIA